MHISCIFKPGKPVVLKRGHALLLLYLLGSTLPIKLGNIMIKKKATKRKLGSRSDSSDPQTIFVSATGEGS